MAILWNSVNRSGSYPAFPKPACFATFLARLDKIASLANSVNIKCREKTLEFKVFSRFAEVCLAERVTVSSTSCSGTLLAGATCVRANATRISKGCPPPSTYSVPLHRCVNRQVSFSIEHTCLRTNGVEYWHTVLQSPRWSEYRTRLHRLGRETLHISVIRMHAQPVPSVLAVGGSHGCPTRCCGFSFPPSDCSWDSPLVAMRAMAAQDVRCPPRLVGLLEEWMRSRTR